jgi:hypothetical protein
VVETVGEGVLHGYDGLGFMVLSFGFQVSGFGLKQAGSICCCSPRFRDG